MPNPKMKKNYDDNNKFLGKGWYGRHLWIWVAMACEKKGGKEINFIFCLGTAYNVSSMEDIENFRL